MPTPTNAFAPPLPPPPPSDPPPAGPPPAGREIEPQPDRSRAGATWVTATGAFLLLAAATVFVAVQWDHLTDAIKLAILGGLTGGFLLAGRRLKPSLPATAGVLYHLGAFLVPVLSAATVVHRGSTWPTILLVEGLVATIGFATLNRVERSVVLDWATVAAVVVLAAGIGATTPVPAPLALVAFAGVAEWRRRQGAAVAWALVAGLGPVITSAVHLLLNGGRELKATGNELGTATLDVLAQLGLTASSGRAPTGAVHASITLGPVGVQVVAAVVGLGAGALLARNARRLHRLELVVAAALSVLVGLLDGWTSLGLHGPANLVGLAALFLLVELGAWASADDPFWAGPARTVAAVAEVLTAVVVTVAGLALCPLVLGRSALAGVEAERVASHLFATPWFGADWLGLGRFTSDLGSGSFSAGLLGSPGSGVGIAILVAGLLAVCGWLVADLRRGVSDNTPAGIAVLVGAGWMPGTLAVTATAMVAVALSTGSAPAVAVAALVIAALLVLSGRPGGHTLATLLVLPAPLLAGDRPVLVAALALAGALTLAAAAVIRSRMVRTDVDAQVPWLLAVGAVLPVGSAAVACSARFGVETRATTAGALLAVAILWVTALVLDRADPAAGAGPDHRLAGLGLVPRAASGLILLAAPVLGPGGLALVAGSLTALTLLDALARRRWWMAVPTGALAGATLGSAVLWVGGTPGQAGLAVLGLAVAATLVDAVVAWRAGPAARSSWLIPVWCTEGAAVLGAAMLTGDDRGALASVIVVTGAIVMFHGLALRRRDRRTGGWEVLVLGGAVTTIGIWLHLVDRHVLASEPYLAPIALALVITGWQARRSVTISSWVAYGPAVVLLGGAALVERLDHGGAGHALVAGVVGLLAVVAGGRLRLIAPLMLGTALLIALTVNESIAVTAGVPTWAWLALGGSILVGSGIAMERAETSPLETGRRVVDVVSERFS